MNILLYTRPKSVLTLGLALVLAADPNLIFHWLALDLGAGGTLLGRLLGLVYLGISLDLWFIRSNQDLPRRNALVLIAVDLAAVAVIAQAQLDGLMNSFGWGLAAVYFGSALGFTWCVLQGSAGSRQAIEINS